MAKHEFQVPAEAAGLRLDQVLGRYVPGLSRHSARVALDMGAVFVDQRRVKVASRTLAAEQHIAVHLGGAFDREVERRARRCAMDSSTALNASIAKSRR
jgi:ribosomal protein S4